MTNEIVIIDDSQPVLMFFTKKLEDLGYKVHAFSHPLEALNTVPLLDPDLVICDYIMFDITGFDIITELRAFGVKRCKYILFTAFDSEAIRELCTKNDINFMSKELNQEKLVEIILNVLN